MRSWIPTPKAKENGTTWIRRLEEEEREKTGIKNLKVRYNKVFGYYIEVTKSNLELVPEGYYPQGTDACQCGAFYYTRIKGTGGADSRRGG